MLTEVLVKIIISDKARMRRTSIAWLYRLLTVYLLGLCLQLGGGGAWAADALDRQIKLDIPATTHLEDALIEWGTKAGMTVMVNTRVVELLFAPRVQGLMSARKALSLLLY